MKKIKISKKIILIAVIIIILGFGAYQIFFKKGAPSFSVETVSRGIVVQEVSESGVVKIGEDVTLSFKSAGRIEKIYAKVGDDISPGQLLAKLDTGQLLIQIQEARANLQAVQAQAQGAQTSLSNAKVSLQTTEQNLTDVTALAQTSLANAYEDALNASEEAYLKIFNALDVVKTIRDIYFDSNDQGAINATLARDSISIALSNIKNSLDIAKANSINQNTDGLIGVTIKSLGDTFSALTTIRQITGYIVYKDIVSSTYKNSLDTHRANINISQAAVANNQQAIATAKVTNEANINTARNQVLAAKGSLIQAEDNIILYQAKAGQAQSQLDFLDNQTRESSIFAIMAGKITKVNKKAGEVTQLSESIFSFMTFDLAQIKTDIYEEDVVKVKIGDPVSVDVTAFPGRTLFGKVLSIDPAEKLIDGVVYYEVTIGLEDSPQEIKAGMTADVTIKTAEKADALVISGSAIVSRSGKMFVQIIENGVTTTEREIQTGLRGNNNMVEVTSGLQEGEQVAIPK